MKKKDLESRQTWLAERVHMFANISTYIAQYVYLPPIIITLMAMIWLLPSGSNDIYWISLFKIPLIVLNPLITVFYSHSVITTSIQLRSHVRPESHIENDVWQARSFVKAIFFIEIIAFGAEAAELIWRSVRFASSSFPDSGVGYSLSLTFIIITAYALAGIIIDIFLNGFSFIVYLKGIGEYIHAANINELPSDEEKPLVSDLTTMKAPRIRAPAPTSTPPAPTIAQSRTFDTRQRPNARNREADDRIFGNDYDD